MFDKVLDDLKDCERDLQMLRDDSEVDSWISWTLRSIIYKLQDAQKNLCSIADSYKVVPNVTDNRRDRAKFETAGELLDFLLGLRDRDLNKRVVIGRNVWDERMFTKWCSVQHKAEWIRTDDENIMIFCK
jgi:hypothetical protein